MKEKDLKKERLKEIEVSTENELLAKSIKDKLKTKEVKK